MADNKEEDSSSSTNDGNGVKPRSETSEGTTNEEAPPNLETTSSEINNSASTEASAKVATKEKKIEVLLKATGDAPIMTKKKWAVNPDQTIGWISEFIKKYLKLGTEDRLFLYINQTFAPAPDQTVKNLYDCYGTDGKLIIHYCKSQAWG